MEDITVQVTELESLEKRQNSEWQVVYQQRKAEDDMILRRRKDQDLMRRGVHAAEDARWIERFARLDEELDGLRKRKRQIERAPLPGPVDNSDHHRLGETPKPSRRKRLKRNGNHGQPTAFDGNGEPLFTRLSDGILVYLECPLEGCGKKGFRTVHALMCHVSDLRGHNKKGVLHGRRHAIETCGRIALGQDDAPVATGSTLTIGEDDPEGDGTIIEDQGVLPSTECIDIATTMDGIVGGVPDKVIEDSTEHATSGELPQHSSLLVYPGSAKRIVEWMENHTDDGSEASKRRHFAEFQQNDTSGSVNAVAETPGTSRHPSLTVVVGLESDPTDELYAAGNIKLDKIVSDLCG